MSTLGAEDAQSLYGRMAYDQSGVEIGEIEAVYLDAEGRQPEWAAVRTGRRETSLAPLAAAVVDEAGVRLAVDHRMVQRAPQGDDDGRFPDQLSEQQEAELAHYYSVDYTAPGPAEGAAGAAARPRRGTTADRLRTLLGGEE
jgi:sporulation protein YlmC with PRC-barrel domain